MIKALGDWLIDHLGSDWEWASTTELFNGDANQTLDVAALLDKVHDLKESF